MNWDRIEGNWKQLKGSVKQQWGRLTDDQFEVIAGEREHLFGRIQESYGINKDGADKQLRAWKAHHKLNAPCSAALVSAPLFKLHLASLS